ncbi:DUF424 family protein [Candidatus Woesearchaeota archaeon]|nr:DUF424 family protein [Candidatus Woesearchaeota archaeon]MBT5396857.1 DUF424 family protein [Candidatus Woesearchaeota archaeon]MBT6367745.1 DUF424 family protein [Candidatus Woesearchaeota archaeon]MBT7762854.1 DUF424 family protein [Candidatus Woesearchaeota archaeon]
MKLIVSQKSGPHGILVVITDKDILGKKFMEGKVQLDLTKEFYKGEEMDEKDVITLCEKARDLHLTGKHAVALGINQNLIDPQNILYVQKVPHAEVVMG